MSFQVRSHNDTNCLAHQCHKWPLTLACGYGKTLRSNRRLNSQPEINEDMDMTATMIAVCAASCDDGTCGACGACGMSNINLLKFRVLIIINDL